MESPSKQLLIENVAKRIEIIEWFSGIVYPEISLNENNEIFIASSISIQVILNCLKRIKNCFLHSF